MGLKLPKQPSVPASLAHGPLNPFPCPAPPKKPAPSPSPPSRAAGVSLAQCWTLWDPTVGLSPLSPIAAGAFPFLHPLGPRMKGGCPCPIAQPQLPHSGGKPLQGVGVSGPWGADLRMPTVPWCHSREQGIVWGTDSRQGGSQQPHTRVTLSPQQCPPKLPSQSIPAFPGTHLTPPPAPRAVPHPLVPSHAEGEQGGTTLPPPPTTPRPPNRAEGRGGSITGCGGMTDHHSPLSDREREGGEGAPPDREPRGRLRRRYITRLHDAGCGGGWLQPRCRCRCRCRCLSRCRFPALCCEGFSRAVLTSSTVSRSSCHALCPSSLGYRKENPPGRKLENPPPKKISPLEKGPDPARPPPQSR